MTDFSQHNFTERDAANSDDYYDAVHGANQNPRHDPTVGELDLEARSSLRRLTRGVSSYTDEQSDGYDVEYRKLRLEKVVLVGVWTEGTVAQIEARLEELAALAETAGSDIVDMLYQRRDKPDAGTYIGRGKVEELKSIVAETGADTVICDGELSPGQMIALEKALNVKVIDRTMLWISSPNMRSPKKVRHRWRWPRWNTSSRACVVGVGRCLGRPVAVPDLTVAWACVVPVKRKSRPIAEGCAPRWRSCARKLPG